MESRRSKTSSYVAELPRPSKGRSPNDSRKRTDFFLSFLKKAFTPENNKKTLDAFN